MFRVTLFAEPLIHMPSEFPSITFSEIVLLLEVLL